MDPRFERHLSMLLFAMFCAVPYFLVLFKKWYFFVFAYFWTVVGFYAYVVQFEKNNPDSAK